MINAFEAHEISSQTFEIPVDCRINDAIMNLMEYIESLINLSVENGHYSVIVIVNNSTLGVCLDHCEYLKVIQLAIEKLEEQGYTISETTRDCHEFTIGWKQHLKKSSDSNIEAGNQ